MSSLSPRVPRRVCTCVAIGSIAASLASSCSVSAPGDPFYGGTAGTGMNVGGETASDDTAGEGVGGSTDGGDQTHDTGQGSECGNGILDWGEFCDDGINLGEYGGCAPGCTQRGPWCGDGVVQEGYEGCDGGGIGTSNCNAHCQIPGAVLMTIRDTVDGSRFDGSVLPHGVALTRWNDSFAAVFGGSSHFVWEFDSVQGTTVRHRHAAAMDETFVFVRGALGLPSGDLVVVGGQGKQAMMLDDTLLPKWTYAKPPGSPRGDGTDEILGVAPSEDGFVLGAQHVNASAAIVHSGYWVEGRSSSGESLWDEIEMMSDTIAFRARDFSSLSDDRNVLLTARPNGAEFRIHGAEGGVLAHRVLTHGPGNPLFLCPGDDAFFVLGTEGELTGFDIHGDPEHELYRSDVPSGALNCVTHSVDSPIIVSLPPSEPSAVTSTMTVQRMLDGEVVWTTTIEIDGNANTLMARGPAMLLEKDKDRVWMVTGGEDAKGDRFAFAAAVAI